MIKLDYFPREKFRHNLYINYKVSSYFLQTLAILSSSKSDIINNHYVLDYLNFPKLFKFEIWTKHITHIMNRLINKLFVCSNFTCNPENVELTPRKNFFYSFYSFHQTIQSRQETKNGE